MTSDPERMVHIVDDDTSTRNALARLLRGAGYTARCYASAGEFMLEDGDAGRGCLLLDLQMPEADGLMLQQTLARRHSALPVIFMSAYRDIPRTVRAIKGGAVDFLTKPIEADCLLAAVEGALRQAGDAPVTGPQAADPAQPGLSDRERVVLRGIVAGRINKQIAAELCLSERTIKSCRADLMRKLGARSLADLIQRGASTLG